MIKRLPLTTRLALGYTAFFALILILLSVGVFFTVQTTLMQEIQDQLRTSSDLIQQDFDASNTRLTDYFESPDILPRTHPIKVEGLAAPLLYVQAAAPDGTVVVTSTSLRGQRLPLDNAVRAIALTGQSDLREVDVAGASILLLTRSLTDDQRIVGVLQIAQPLREIDRTLRLMAISLVATSVIAIVTALRGGAWLAARTLLPVGQVAQTARQIVRAEDLAQRVPNAPGDDEIGQLTATVNEMLERLEQLFNAQRHFVADVSHELRTPLTAMRGNLEILRRGAAQSPQARDESLADIEREVNRLIRLASDLLLLAQVEAGLHLRHEPVALDELVLEVVRDLQPLAHGVTLTPRIAEQAAARGDRDRLKQALLNMTTNALQHTPRGGRVAVSLTRDHEHAHIVVSDTGTGITATDLPFVFDRFYRADAARSRRAGGAGLGLAIVKWIAVAHGGTVSVQSTIGQGSTFALTLPLDGPPS